MARKWSEVRKEAVDAGMLDEQRVRHATKAAREVVRAHRLADVRKSQHMRQVDIAASMHVTQSRVSQIEKGELSKAEIGTLASYVQALGGKLKIVADFGDEQLTLG